MTLAGTRPILQDELLKYELHHRARIAIKPGICKTIKERNIKIVFIEDSVFGNLVKKVKQEFPKVQVVTFYHDIKADLYPQWMKKERNIISEIEFRMDQRDLVNGLMLLAEKGIPGEVYNLSKI